MNQIYQSLVDSAICSAVALLEHLSNDELKTLLEDDAKLDELLKDLPHVRNLVTEKEMLLAQNKSLAEFNLSRDPMIKTAKRELLQSYETATALQSEVAEKMRQVEALADQRSVETTLALLQTAAAEAEEESEKIADTFLQGDGALSVDAFLNQFAEKRTLAHARRLKSEKLADLVRLLPANSLDSQHS